MKPNIRQLKKWIAALDSGEYEQTKETLQDAVGFCCLGVGCKVIIPEHKQECIDGELRGATPENQRYAPKWLQDINMDFYDKTGRQLVSLNDSFDFTFSEIATLLELVYIHKMLD